MKTLDRLAVPIIQGGMGVGISMGGLAGAVAACGGMGVISTVNIGFREADFWKSPEKANRRALQAEIAKARQIAKGKGIIAVNAMVATTGFADLVKTACKSGIDAVISGAGLPLSLPELTKGFDVMIAPIVSGGRAAKTILSMWQKRHNRKADFIVVEGSRAGGHLGFTREEAAGSAKPLPQLICEVVREAGDIPIFAAGSIFDRTDMQEVKSQGASGVQIATRFIATEECDASRGFKDVIVRANAEDVMILQSPVGMPGRGLKTPLMKRVAAGERFAPKQCIRCIHSCDPAKTPYCINQALIKGYYGNYEEGLFFCGDNVGRINEMTTVKALMEELAAEWSQI
ncbi:NAD(P)H-dependent flavin oxidoreductase [Senimuribacter intestinalis]|uniref:NAD(P)H-dependent flavin oxidoreductase n=1 Tax=Senimuribacter intestinalis TaxID=2941507 RepID=UPI0020406F31|nr:nitronate monooxygenase family protein [Senimuribacter intestinalis]